MNAYDLFINEVNARDKVACGVTAVVESLGLAISRTGSDGHVACVNTLCSVWEIDKGETLRETLRLLIAAAGHDHDALDGKLIAGLSRFLTVFNGEVDRDVLVRKLAKYPAGPAGVLGNAKGLHRVKKKSLPSCIMETLVDAYNQGRRSGKIELA